MSQKIYEMITEKILDLMNEGIVPWHKPWHGVGPKNMVTGRYYRGINVWLLSCSGTTPYWLTFNQIKNLNGSLRKGEKGHPVIFWKWIDKKRRNEETGDFEKYRFPMLRYYKVFNLSQVDGIKPPEESEKKTFNPIAEAAGIINRMQNKPAMTHGSDKAFYRPTEDRIYLPEFENFKSAEEYYSTLYHEAAHSTGHVSRLARKEIMSVNFFGSHDYSKEELVAEMTASFLCGIAGIENKTIKNSAAYLQSWTKSFKDDKKMVICAAAQAQKAADYILGTQDMDET